MYLPEDYSEPLMGGMSREKLSKFGSVFFIIIIVYLLFRYIFNDSYVNRDGVEGVYLYFVSFFSLFFVFIGRGGYYAFKWYFQFKFGFGFFVNFIVGGFFLFLTFMVEPNYKFSLLASVVASLSHAMILSFCITEFLR